MIKIAKRLLYSFYGQSYQANHAKLTSHELSEEATFDEQGNPKSNRSSCKIIACFFAMASFGMLAGILIVWIGLASARKPTENVRKNQIRHHSWNLNGDNDFDYLLFVQRWPASTCVDGKIIGRGGSSDAEPKCAISEDLSTTDWTLHGLWPSRFNGSGPESCNKTAKWDVNLLNPIRDQLLLYWPNLETTGQYDSFWQHEWFKHGTCAEILPPLNGELNFFSKPLDLRSQWNLYKALQQQGIVPDDDQTFSHDQFVAALKSVFGFQLEVLCSYSSDTKKHYVAEIRFCIDKSFNLIVCPGKKFNQVDDCPQKSSNLYYPLIKPSTQRETKEPRRHRHGRKHSK